MFNPAATIVLCLQQQKRAQKERERKQKELEGNIEEPKEKEVEVTKIVRNITVTYEDGSTRVLKRGLALDLLNEDQAALDCTNLKDEDILTFLSVLVSVGKDKGIIPEERK